MSRTNETRYIKMHESVNVDYMQAGVNLKSWLIRAVAIKDLLGILVIRNLNFINHVILENI